MLQGVASLKGNQQSNGLQTPPAAPSQNTQPSQTVEQEPTVEIIGDPQNVASVPELNTTTLKQLSLLEAGKSFDQLHQSSNQAPMGPAPQARLPGNFQTEFDPRAMLTIRSSSGNKAVHITQFLSEKTKRRRQNQSKRDLVLGTTESERLVFRTDEKHPYSGISVGEWGAANLRLLNHLLSTGALARSHLEFYLAYSTHILDALETYEWESILEYDFQYRELQAEHKFMWGTPATQLEHKILIPRTHRLSVQKSNRSWGHRQSRPYQPAGKTQDCKLFLAHGSCRFGQACIYNHPNQTNLGKDHPVSASKN